MIDVVSVSFLLTLIKFHTLFWYFHCNTGWNEPHNFVLFIQKFSVFIFYDNRNIN